MNDTIQSLYVDCYDVLVYLRVFLEDYLQQHSVENGHSHQSYSSVMEICYETHLQLSIQASG